MVAKRQSQAGPKTLKHREAVALAIAVRDVDEIRSVLLVQRTQDDDCPKWVFPGGKIASGEPATRAARRELFEETGVTAARGSLIGRRIHPVSGADLFYVAVHDLNGTASRQEPDKHQAVRWIPVDDLDAVLGTGLYQEVARFLRRRPPA